MPGLSEVFTRRVAALPFNVANPMWVTGTPDLDYHVRRTVLPAPGSQHQLEECVADLHTPAMDRDRPLWELHVIEGLEHDRVALYIKTHHAGLDGAVGAGVPDVVGGQGRIRAGAVPRQYRSPSSVTARDLLLAGVQHQLDELRKLPGAAAELAQSLPGGDKAEEE